MRCLWEWELVPCACGRLHHARGKGERTWEAMASWHGLHARTVPDVSWPYASPVQCDWHVGTAWKLETTLSGRVLSRVPFCPVSHIKSQLDEGKACRMSWVSQSKPTALSLVPQDRHFRYKKNNSKEELIKHSYWLDRGMKIMKAEISHCNYWQNGSATDKDLAWKTPFC